MYGECRLISPNNTGSTAHSVTVTHRNGIVGVCFCTSCGPQWKRDISSVFSYICSAATAFFLFFVTAWKRPDCCCCEDVSLIMEGEGATGGRDPHYTTCQMVQDHAACVDEFRHSCRWWWHSKASQTDWGKHTKGFREGFDWPGSTFVISVMFMAFPVLEAFLNSEKKVK